jgi:hypothetical protein
MKYKSKYIYVAESKIISPAWNESWHSGARWQPQH